MDDCHRHQRRKHLDNRQQQQIAGIRERQESALTVMTVMLMMVVSGMQPLPLIKSTGLNGLHGPWVTDSVPQQFVCLTVRSYELFAAMD